MAKNLVRDIGRTTYAIEYSHVYYATICICMDYILQIAIIQNDQKLRNEYRLVYVFVLIIYRAYKDLLCFVPESYHSTSSYWS